MNELTPNFSVAMCVYGKDNPEWFETAINSVLNQTVKPSEIVLVVDGPVPDELDTIISKFENRNIFKVIRFSVNKGHGDARRASVNACTNEIVAIMDADDISVSNRFEKQLAMFNSDSDLDIVGGNIAEFIGEPDNIVGKRVVPPNDDEIKKYLKTRCPMNLNTVMFKKSSVNKVGGFIDWYCDEDYYLWVRMYLARMKFANMQEILVHMRICDDTYRRRGGLRYFKSEAKLQKYMLDNKVINFKTYISNIAKRLIVQVLLPNKIRAWVFKTFARN